MTREVYKRAAARRDLVQHFVYLVENAGLETADRFLANAERSFSDLAEQPAMGSPLTLKRPELAVGRSEIRVSVVSSSMDD